MRCNFTPYEGKERYIFVSYSHKDSEKVIPIMEYIAKKGYRLWYDEGLTPSSEWTEDIEQHIKHCYIFLALISRNAQESENCQDEIVFAKNNKKILMIVRLEDVELRKGLGLQLSRKQITDSFKYPNIEDFYQTLLCDPELKYCHASMTGQETSGEAYYKNKKQQADELEQAAKDFVRERNFIEAQKTYSEAASIRDELFSLRKGLQERKERYVCYESLADTMEFQENYADAYTYRNLALQDLECLAEHYSAADFQKMRSVRYGRLAELLRRQDSVSLNRIRGLYEKKQEIDEQLFHDDVKSDEMRELGESYRNLAGILNEQGETEQAKVLYEKCAVIWDWLVQIRKVPQDQRILAHIYSALAEINFQQKRFDTAVDYFKRSMETLSELYRNMEMDSDGHKLCRVYGRLAGVLYNLDNANNAEKILERAEALQNSLSISDLDIDDISNLVWAYEQKADFYKRNQQIYEVRTSCRVAVTLAMKLENSPNTKDKMLLVECCINMGNILLEQKNWADAEKQYQLALKTIEEILKQDENDISHLRLKCNVYGYIASVYYEQKKYHKAIPYYEQQIRCMETLFEKYGNIEDGETLTQYYNRLVDFPRVKLRQRRQLVKFGITVSNKLYNRTQDDKYKNSIKWFEERNHPLKFLATYNRPLFCVFAVGIYVFLTKMIIAGTGILLRIIVKYNLTQDIYGVTLEHVVLTVFLTILVAGSIVYIRYCWHLPIRKTSK